VLPIDIDALAIILRCPFYLLLIQLPFIDMSQRIADLLLNSAQRYAFCPSPGMQAESSLPASSPNHSLDMITSSAWHWNLQLGHSSENAEWGSRTKIIRQQILLNMMALANP
jgi:hypothetical protein